MGLEKHTFQRTANKQHFTKTTNKIEYQKSYLDILLLFLLNLKIEGIIYRTKIKWRSGRDSNPRPPA